MEHSFLEIEVAPPVARLRLNRPEVRNALHIGMIRELNTTIRELERQQGIRILQLSAAGPDFCSGADLHWMQEGMNQTGAVLRSESLELAGLFHSLATTRLIVITSVRGRARGGALGLVASSDVVVAEPDAGFAFSEVRLGLVPATIAPYVILKTGIGRAKELMVSGREFSGEMALRYGLVHHLSGSEGLEAATDDRVKELLRNGPEAMSGVKSLLNRLGSHPVGEEIMELTAELIARHRTSSEGQEGMRAFFEKRKPNWE
jgi:methylglutaconyl-CoA hydratase